MTEIDQRDAILQAHTPAIMVPRHGALSLMEKPGHRFLVAANGMWLEVLRPWLNARVQIGYFEMPLPFGDLEQTLQYAFSAIDLRRIQDRFLADAYKAMPNECAAWAVYNEKSGALEYRPLLADIASPVEVEFHRPRLADHEHLAIDLHSHGAGPAGFSPKDDADDIGEVKYAVVAGTLDSVPTFATRLCLLGTFVEEDQ